MWNYRLMKHKHPKHSDEDWIAVHEVYYDKEGKITHYSIEPIWAYGESEEEIRNDLEHMITALSKPVLPYSRDILSKKL